MDLTISKDYNKKDFIDAVLKCDKQYILKCLQNVNNVKLTFWIESLSIYMDVVE